MGEIRRRLQEAAKWSHINMLRSRIHFGGHARYILPTLSPSQPVIADEEILCWGTILNLVALFALLCDALFVGFWPFLLFFSLCIACRKYIYIRYMEIKRILNSWSSIIPKTRSTIPSDVG